MMHYKHLLLSLNTILIAYLEIVWKILTSDYLIYTFKEYQTNQTLYYKNYCIDF